MSPRSSVLVVLTIVILAAGCRSRPQLAADVSWREAPPASPLGGLLSGGGKGQGWDLIAEGTPGAWGGLNAAPPGGRDRHFSELKDQRWAPVYFGYDQTTIVAAEQEKLETLAQYLAKEKDQHVVIGGHCDERGSDEYNRALGERRAIAVRDQLVRLGVTRERIETISYGEERPANRGHSDADHALNRRAEFVVVVSGN